MRARVFVTLKPSVFDPQGRTVTEALHTLGYDAVRDVRQGKYFELDVDAANAADAAPPSRHASKRAPSSVYWAAWARSQRTAAFTSCACAGHWATPLPR